MLHESSSRPRSRPVWRGRSRSPVAILRTSGAAIPTFVDTLSVFALSTGHRRRSDRGLHRPAGRPVRVDAIRPSSTSPSTSTRPATPSSIPCKFVVRPPADRVRSGCRNCRAPFESVLEAPKTGFDTDTTLAVAPGRDGRHSIGAQRLGRRLSVCAVTVHLREDRRRQRQPGCAELSTYDWVDPNCGFRSFATGDTNELSRARPAGAPRADRRASRRHAPARRSRRALADHRSGDRTRTRHGVTLIQAVEERKAARNADSAGGRAAEASRRAGRRPASQSRALGDEITRLERELAEAEAELSRDPARDPEHHARRRPRRRRGEQRHRAELGHAASRTTASSRTGRSARSSGSIDLERGAKISGSGFVVFRGAGARLVRALMNFMSTSIRASTATRKSGPRARQSREHDRHRPAARSSRTTCTRSRTMTLFLIPTAEVPVTNLYRDEILPESELPKGFVAYSPCFRREAGSAGKDTRGLLRVHEFDKVELVRYATPEDVRARSSSCSRATPRRCSSGSELPYRRVLLAAGDTGFASAHDVRSRGVGAGRRRSGSRCRRAATSPTFRRAAPTSGIARRRAKSRASSTRSTARGSRFRASSPGFSSTISRRTAACSSPLRSALSRHRAPRLSNAPARSGNARHDRRSRAARVVRDLYAPRRERPAARGVAGRPDVRARVQRPHRSQSATRPTLRSSISRSTSASPAFR